MSETRRPASAKALFSQTGFRTLWLARFVSVFGDFLAIFGVISRITFRLHGSTTDVALVIVVSFLRPLFLGAPGVELAMTGRAAGCNAHRDAVSQKRLGRRTV